MVGYMKTLKLMFVKICMFFGFFLCLKVVIFPFATLRVNPPLINSN